MACEKRLQKPKYLSPEQLARLQSCSGRTIREWCKKGLIPEANQTPGGHWRVAMPLSGRTRTFLEIRSGDWPFKEGAGRIQGDWDPDLAESLLLAQLYQRDIEEGLPVPSLAELGELKRDLPDPDGLDAVQRQNRKARKQGFGSIDHDPFADD